MTFEEIKKKLKRSRAFFKYLIAFSGIVLSSMFIFLLITNYNTKGLLIAIIGIITSIYMLYKAWQIDKFTIFGNELTEAENRIILKNAILEYSNALMSSNYAIYTHISKNAWKTTYDIHLYAGHNFIAVNVIMDYSRPLDFGASTAQRNKIINLFEEHKAIYKSQKDKLTLTAAH